MYQNPAFVPSNTLDEAQLQEHFDLFFEDMYIELSRFGEIEEVNVCDNVGDHLVGNLYVMFTAEESAARCVEALNNRHYAGRPIYAELSPVTDFGECGCAACLPFARLPLPACSCCSLALN
jgi:splicing factor U2AF subunit